VTSPKQEVDVLRFKSSLNSYKETTPENFIAQHFIFSYTPFIYVEVTIFMWVYSFILKSIGIDQQSSQVLLVNTTVYVSLIIVYSTMRYLDIRRRLHPYFLANAYHSVAFEATNTAERLRSLIR
ncbi:MAG: hypothetical protein WA461_15320, partial [Nitrososphaeraceae archaeon]